MTQTARDVLTAFDGLPPTDQQQVAAEILRRAPEINQVKAGAEARERASAPDDVHRRTRPFIKLPEGAELVSETLIRERR